MDSYFLKYKGYALIEISIGLLILAVMLTLVLPWGHNVIADAKNVQQRNNLEAIGIASREFYQQTGHWPSSVNDLQPVFLSLQIDPVPYFLSSQENILRVSSVVGSLFFVKPRGIVAQLDYR